MPHRLLSQSAVSAEKLRALLESLPLITFERPGLLAVIYARELRGESTVPYNREVFVPGDCSRVWIRDPVKRSTGRVNDTDERPLISPGLCLCMCGNGRKLMRAMDSANAAAVLCVRAHSGHLKQDTARWFDEAPMW